MAAWEQALKDLVRTRGTALVGYAYLLCGDRREAEDLVQDALVKTFARGRAGARMESMEGYVRRAILSTYLDGFRRRKRWAAVRHLVAVDDVRTGPEAAVTAHIDVRAALDTLAPRERACVVLRYFEDLTVPQIADALSLAEGSVKRYLSDGVRHIQDLLGPVDLPEHHDDVAVLTSGDAMVGTSKNYGRTR